MPFLQSSGAISIANLNSFFPGSGTSMSNFYRGGGRVPTTKTVTTVTREPTSGDFYNVTTAYTFYYSSGDISWFNIDVTGGAAVPNSTSFTVGNITYFRGTARESNEYGTYYGVFRTITSTSTVNINTGIPSSGQISLNQFYGAETP